MLVASTQGTAENDVGTIYHHIVRALNHAIIHELACLAGWLPSDFSDIIASEMFAFSFHVRTVGRVPLLSSSVLQACTSAAASNSRKLSHTNLLPLVCPLMLANSVSCGGGGGGGLMTTIRGKKEELSVYTVVVLSCNNKLVRVKLRDGHPSHLLSHANAKSGLKWLVS